MRFLAPNAAMDFVDWSRPANWDSALNAGLAQWLLAVPGTMGFGSTGWRSLLHRGQNGTLNSFATPATAASGWSTPFGRRGGVGAIKFDSSNDYVSYSTAGVSGYPFTLAAWSRIQSTSGSSAPIVCLGASTANRGLYQITTRPFSSTVHRFGIDADDTDGGGGTDLYGDTTAYSVDWHHCCGVFVSATLRYLYVDGRLLATRTGSVGFQADAASGSTFVGTRNVRGSPNSTLWHNGLIDDVRVWGRDLSPADVLAVYQDSAAGYPGTLRRIDLEQWFVDTVAATGGFKGYWAAWRAAQILGGGAV